MNRKMLCCESNRNFCIGNKWLFGESVYVVLTARAGGLNLLLRTIQTPGRVFSFKLIGIFQCDNVTELTKPLSFNEINQMIFLRALPVSYIYRETIEKACELHVGKSA